LLQNDFETRFEMRSLHSMISDQLNGDWAMARNTGTTITIPHAEACNNPDSLQLSQHSQWYSPDPTHQPTDDMLSRPGCGGLSEEGGLGLRLGPAQLKMRSDEEIEAEAAAERLKQSFDERPHRRFNPLTRSWVLCSPHRAKRCHHQIP
jgi:hypothetical protein